MSHNTMLAMIHKPGMSAGKRWHKTYRFGRLRHLARVVKGVKFRDGVEDRRWQERRLTTSYTRFDYPKRGL